MKLIKDNKWRLLITSAVILLPAVLGLIFYDRLPDIMTTHWGADGVADGQSSKLFAVTVIPLIILAAHWLCVLASAFDKKNEGQNSKVFGVVLWIMPVVSLVASVITFLASTGTQVPVARIMIPLLGLMLIALGNYMPKTAQNRTIGVKIKWTLESADNWYATHRFAGWLWTAAGLAVIAAAFLPYSISVIILPAALVTAAFAPMIYSYIYSRKHPAENNTAAPEKAVSSKKTSVVSAIIAVVILALVGVLMFSGDISVEYGEDSFTVSCPMVSDLTVSCDRVDSIELRDSFNTGMREFGVGSARLSAGSFRNDEFGSYTLYSYTAADSWVVVTSADKKLVISGPDDAATREIYNRLTELCGPAEEE